MRATVTIPFPPSVNHYWRSVNGRVLISKEGRLYRDAIVAQAVAERWPNFDADESLRVDIEAWMPDRRRRDLDNVLKAALDSMTHAGMWSDDGQIDALSIKRVPTLGGMLKVSVEVIE